MTPFDTPHFHDDELEGDALARPDTVDAIATRADVVDRLRSDGEFFIEFFLPDELTSRVPGFHIEIWQLLTNTAMQRVLLAIPRDHAKTTLSKLGVVWYFLFTNHRFCVYLSNTNTIAKNACKDIMGYLKSPNFRSVFGDIKIEKESETDSLWMFELTMPDGRIKKCILRAVGAGQQMRGINIDNQRPDMAVVDDVEDNENTDSELLQKKLDKWIFGPFIKALARQKKIIWLGNMLQKTSLLARLSQNPRWNPIVFGCLVEDSQGRIRPLWPERWPLAELMEDFQEYAGLGLTETWLCEMMNMPGFTKNGFNPESIRYEPLPLPEDCTATFLTLDPAFGENEQNDDSAIVAHAVVEGGPPMVVDYIVGKFDEMEILENMLTLAYRWGAWTWGIESVAAQRVLITLFTVLLATKRLNHTVEMLPLTAGKGDPKIQRIKSWVSMMKNGEYAVFEGALEIFTQLMAYNMTKKSNKDDLIDSCAYGPQMLANYEGIIMSQALGGELESKTAQSGMEVASV